MAKVLFVDDELLITNSLKRGLITEPYESFFAHGGEEALMMLEKHDFHVLVTDMKMPGMNGLELLKRAKELYPNVVRIVLSGYTALPQVLVTINQGDIFKFITKPWDLENEFKHVIREAISYADFLREGQKKEASLKRINTTYQNMLKQYDQKLESIRMDVAAAGVLSKRIRMEITKIIKQSAMTPTEKNRLQLLMNLNEFFIESSPILPVKFSVTQGLERIQKILATHLPKAYSENVKVQSTTDLGPFEAKFPLVEDALTFIIQQFVEDDAYLRVRVLARPLIQTVQDKEVNHIAFLCEFRHVSFRSEEDMSVIIEIINQFISAHGVILRYALQGDQLILEFDFTL
jgi:two-component system response regulator HupR/HoxA